MLDFFHKKDGWYEAICSDGKVRVNPEEFKFQITWKEPEFDEKSKHNGKWVTKTINGEGHDRDSMHDELVRIGRKTNNYLFGTNARKTFGSEIRDTFKRKLIDYHDRYPVRFRYYTEQDLYKFKSKKFRIDFSATHHAIRVWNKDYEYKSKIQPRDSYCEEVLRAVRPLVNHPAFPGMHKLCVLLQQGKVAFTNEPWSLQ